MSAHLPRLKAGDVSAVFAVERATSLFAVLQVVQGVRHGVHGFVHAAVREITLLISVTTVCVKIISNVLELI